MTCDLGKRGCRETGVGDAREQGQGWGTAKEMLDRAECSTGKLGWDSGGDQQRLM